MKSVRLAFGFDRETAHPLHRFVVDHAAFERYRLVHWNHSVGGETILVFRLIGDPAAYRAELETLSTVEQFAVEPTGDRSFTVYVRDRAPLPWKTLLDSYTEDTLLVIPPVDYGMDYTLRCTVVGEPTALQTAIEAVPDEIDLTIERIGEYTGGGSVATVLTDRQREVLRAARRIGYYEVPRTAGVRAVADEVDCAPGTAAEHLRKAESRIMAHLSL